MEIMEITNFSYCPESDLLNNREVLKMEKMKENGAIKLFKGKVKILERIQKDKEKIRRRMIRELTDSEKKQVAEIANYSARERGISSLITTSDEVFKELLNEWANKKMFLYCLLGDKLRVEVGEQKTEENELREILADFAYYIGSTFHSLTGDSDGANLIIRGIEDLELKEFEKGRMKNGMKLNKFFRKEIVNKIDSVSDEAKEIICGSFGDRYSLKKSEFEKKKIFISINLADMITASFASFTTCYYPTSMYAAGAWGKAFDSSSLIGFCSGNERGTIGGIEVTYQKEWRQYVFFDSYSYSFVQSRHYPQFRKNASKIVREGLQERISESLKVKNYWFTSRERGTIIESVESGWLLGLGYDDLFNEGYDHYRLTSLLKKDKRKYDFRISLNYPCPSCGMKKDASESQEIILCESCMDKVIWCYSCEERIVYLDDARRLYNGESICECCYEDSYSYCYCCDELFHYDDGVFNENIGEWYCDSCYSEEFFYCESCEEDCFNSDSMFDEESGTSFCSDCFLRIESEREERESTI